MMHSRHLSHQTGWHLGCGSGAARRGITLVEVLIALTVLAVVLLPVMVGFSQALIATSQSSTSVIASSIARETVENLKAAGYANIQSQPRTPADLRPGDHYFQVEVTVTEEATLQLKTGTVKVYQTGSQSPMVTLTTYFVQAGV